MSFTNCLTIKIKRMKILLRTFLAIAFFVIAGTSAQAADNLITQQITIKLDKAGTLPNRIGSTKKYLITNLKIIGEINGTDLRMIRDMAGRRDLQYNKGNTTSGKLSKLDLSEAKIVKGGDYYCCYYDMYDREDELYYTSDNSLGSYTFKDCSGLTSVKIPSNVTSIGWYAFSGCSGLTSITIPSSVTYIGEHAFENCSGLTSVTIPSSVTKIGVRAFDGCSGLTSLAIPSSVTKIDNYAFYGCTGLTSVTIHSSVTEIGDCAFCGCTGLTSLNIPSSKIGQSAFYGCTGLSSLNILPSVTDIGWAAFQECTGLTSVTIPSSVTYIRGAFSGCTGLTSVTIPSSVTNISEAFSGCTGLTSVTIPSSVTDIRAAFSGCTGLTSVYVSWQSPISAKNTFDRVDKSKCVLYVPQGTYQDYFLADEWGDFDNIVEYDPTGINSVNVSSDTKEVSRYSMDGQLLSAPTKGVNIVKYSDGSVKKVTVK